jgi:hypothetical protein
VATVRRPVARNDSWGASYERVPAADGRPAIRRMPQFLMTDLMRSECLTSLVDIEVDFDGGQTEPCQPNTPVAHRLSHVEVLDFLHHGLGLAFEVRPLARG